MSETIRMSKRALLLLAPSLAALGAGMAAAPAQDTPERIATDVANDLTNRRLADIVARFTPDMAMGLPLRTLDKVWSSVLRQGGPVRELGPARLIEVTSTGAANGDRADQARAHGARPQGQRRP